MPQTQVESQVPQPTQSQVPQPTQTQSQPPWQPSAAAVVTSAVALQSRGGGA